MLSEEWLNHTIRVVFSYWSTDMWGDALQQKCVERVSEMIRQYREAENPDTYHEYIMQRIQLLMKTMTEHGRILGL